ncbi:hemerythrin domain-containing protein [Rhodospirillaceae bacterium SYSU D60014]|jgi:hemerythrin superfamily protein|uniref:hemerythrin domain-containing protein n=1 Tax=Virgifigura deserti TaxID=2268457 RepID=UPI000E6728BC
MDLWQLIKNDHDNVDEIFRQILQESSGDLRDKLFLQLKRELMLHTKVEEDVFYPALKHFDETRMYLADAHKEHDEVKTRLEELGKGSKDSPEWARKLGELKGVIQHHVRDEEDKIFPAAQKVIDASRAEDLKRQIEREKSQVLQHELV